MITLSKSGNSVTFTFDENSGYLQNGTIDVPINSLALITDESDMATFRKSASNDIFISARYEEFGMSKAELEAWYKENMVGSTGGGVDSGTVQTMIDESISGKADADDVYTIEEVDDAISAATDDMATETWVGAQGYITGVDLSNYATLDNVAEAVSGKADIGDIPDVSNYFDGAEYDSGTTRINFYHGNTVKASIDASQFVIDGMIDDVRIETISGVSYLVIDFNTASGKEDIQIPLTDIFDPSNYYNKTEIDNIVSGLNESIDTKLDASAYTPTDLSEYWTSAQTTSAIDAATSGKADTTAVTEAISAATYDMATKTWVGEQGYLTEHQSLSAYSTTEEVNSAISEAVSGKVDTSTFETYSGSVETALSGKQDTLSAGTNITISGNVISAEGGGKAVSGGTNISITTGETADTINCTLPISADTRGIYTTSSYPFTSNAPKSYNAVFGNSNVIDVFGSSRRGDFNALFGDNNAVKPVGGSSNSHFIAGSYNIVKGNNSHRNALFGYNNISQNHSEFGCGQYNVSSSASTNFGLSGNTLFSVGNGTADNARHNAFEIRQNGDIYLSLNGQDVKLQDQLGGGSITIDPTLDSGSTNAVANSAITTAIEAVSGAIPTTTSAVTSGSTDVVESGAVYDQLGGLKLVKLTQSAYDALSPNYDSNTLYIIVN